VVDTSPQETWSWSAADGLAGSRKLVTWCWVWGSGFGVQGSKFRDLGPGSGAGSSSPGVEVGVRGSGSSIFGLGFRV